MQALKDMLKQILDMDEKARRYTDEIESKKEEAGAALREERELLLAQKLRGAQEQAEKAKEPSLEAARKSIEQLKKSGEEAMQRLEAEAQNNEEKWVSAVTERTLFQN